MEFKQAGRGESPYGSNLSLLVLQSLSRFCCFEYISVLVLLSCAAPSFPTGGSTPSPDAAATRICERVVQQNSVISREGNAVA